jgi:PAS domain S-box-containing protein
MEGDPYCRFSSGWRQRRAPPVPNKSGSHNYAPNSSDAYDTGLRVNANRAVQLFANGRGCESNVRARGLEPRQDGNVNEWNNKAAEITGFTKMDILGRNLVSSFITPDYQKTVKQVLDNALQGNEQSNFEFPLFTKSGNRVDLLLNAATRHDAHGRIVGMVGVGQVRVCCQQDLGSCSGLKTGRANRSVGERGQC